MTITSLTIATLSPFMVADAQEKAVAPEVTTSYVYNWESQTATEGVGEGEFEAGQVIHGSQSYVGPTLTIDDWYLA